MLQDLQRMDYFRQAQRIAHEGEHYHKICEILHVETATPPAVHKNWGTPGLWAGQLVKIVKRSEKLTHEKIPPEDFKQIVTFC